ncbi:MAG: ethylbenzene dehydrogenase-related protein [Planctomycetota bacterium]
MQAEASDAKRDSRKIHYSHLFRLLHWVLPVTMVVGVGTGFSLHAVARPEWSLFSGVMPSWAWSGRIQVIHLVSAVLFAPSILAALVLYVRRKTRLRPLHVILLGGGVLMFMTGLLMVHPLGPSWLYWISRLSHAVIGLVVLPVAFIWHLIEGLVRYPRLLVPSFHPWASWGWKQLLWFVPLLLVTACLVFNILPRPLVGRRLVAGRVESPAADLSSLPWDNAQPLVVELANGASFDKGRTAVTLQALHDGKEVFVRAQWADPTEDRQYQPWRKTETGWKHLFTVKNDESYYYEDKFSLVFPTQKNWKFDTLGCAAACHAGEGQGHAFGIKGFETPIDVWHWKATRTDPLGQVDDKYWGELPGDGSGGRHGDSKKRGGYQKNVSEDGTHPAYLPATPQAIHWGGVLSDQAVPYDSAEAAELAKSMRAGAIVPGIVFSPFEGNRGDVQCDATHKDGYWELLIRRKLDTGHEHDTKFVPGQSYSFGCAAFDHSSKRHAYGFQVYTLAFER